MIEAPELLQFLEQEETRAVDIELNDERATALSFYRGEPFGDEIDGRSKLRTRDVAEVIDYMAVSVARTMLSSDRIVEFEPMRPQMVQIPGEDGQPAGQKDIASEKAQEATDRVHWNFMREQDGYTILMDGIKAGLLEKSGIWKTWCEHPLVPQPVRLNALEIDASDNIVEAVELEGVYDLDELTGEPIQVYDAVAMVPGEPVFKDAAIPNEEFFVSPDARTLDSAAYVGNTSRQSLFDLEAMGYDAELLVTLWQGESTGTQQLRDARDADRSEKEADVDRREFGRVVTLREEYCRWFWQGRYQLVRIHRVGSKILSVEPAAMQPYVLWCPFPMQHRLIGHSLADKVLDIQVVRSHMLRQAMDNLYLSNAPRVFLPEEGIGTNTIDDLLDVAPGGIVRGKAGAAPQPWEVPFVADNAFSAMEIMAGEKESRTGITRLNQGLEADAMNKTATGTALMQASGQQIEESVARQVANAVGELFEKKLRLMMEYMGPHPFKIDGEVREITPQDWPQDMRLAVRVGLGTGNKDKRLQAFGMLKEAMAEAASVGLVGKEQVFNAAKLLVGNLGVGAVTQFFKDPSVMGEESEGPPPEVQAKMMELQAKQQMHEAELESRFAIKQAEIQLKMLEKQLDIELAAAKTEQEAQIAYDRIAAQMQLAREKIAVSAMSNVTVGSFRDGGSLAA